MGRREELLAEIEAWKGINPILWKRAYNELQELNKEPEIKPKPKSKPKPKKAKKYAPEDVNKDGSVDIKDAVAVVTKLLKKKRKKK